MQDNTAKQIQKVDVLVVGAGFGGMYALHKFREKGLRTVAIEAGAGVGGTWYWNRYPGARCDVMTIDYSYSFSDEIQQEWTWSERFCAQGEILSYANFVAEKLDLLRDIRFGTRANVVEFDDATQRWRIETEQGDIYDAKFCILSTGPLSVPKGVAIPGADSFEGELYLSARWPHHDVELDGKRIGVIGTGSSGVQIVSVVAHQASHLHVFQRTPSFSLPMRNQKLDPDYVAQVKKHYNAMRAVTRMTFSGGTRPASSRPLFSVTVEERNAMLEEAWQTAGHNLLGIFSDLLLNKDANDVVADFVRKKIGETVKDPQTAEKLMPRGEPIFARRPCLDTNYYEVFNQDNVTLVDCLTTPIERITPKGVIVDGKEIELDVIIAATGFDALTGALLSIDIKGRAGASLREKWSEGARSYLGMTIQGFPNLFTTASVNGPSALANFILLNEQNVNWISDLVDHMTAQGHDTVEATEAAEDRWMERIAQLASKSLMPKANTWYTGTNIPGKPRSFPMYAGGLGKYTEDCQNVANNGYEGLIFGSQSATPATHKARETA
ncbi:flavin-containing monooxygenase [Pseudooceanicola aestuarii]|uniref:flavin-containing monooxygenase n=1 Tax=Pseudooceanicola aestuarii TaxID=2697319 RepID=UPI0013D6E329|nr:NAD(P)/FAD-dependent oxidoreductase [Pseudooceanicola aestuarii]